MFLYSLLGFLVNEFFLLIGLNFGTLSTQSAHVLPLLTLAKGFPQLLTDNSDESTSEGTDHLDTNLNTTSFWCGIIGACDLVKLAYNS